MKSQNHGEQIVARGTWLYNNAVPFPIEIRSRPVSLAGSRFVEDEHGNFVLDQNTPVPSTPDGFVYHLSVGAGGEFKTLAEAKNWADAQPWVQ